uniref:Cdc23 domain-containing protein n=1 Tax=Globisporangium ultimum (strain ATCC 200006 / CBS 805.95 / DAOM BR144) TaxID=431595 RepID=K3W6X7_GLOUD
MAAAAAAAITSASLPADAFARRAESEGIDALEATLVEKVQHYLGTCVYTNAVFLAERLVAHHRSEDNLCLLATCYHRANRVNQAIAVLANAKAPSNRYLLAVCCFQQDKLVEAENALRGEGDWHFVDATAKEEIPCGAAGLYLMGRICRRANRREQAIVYFAKSLDADATLWSAYEELCELGADIDASRFFGSTTYSTSIASDGSEKPEAWNQENDDDTVDDENNNQDADSDTIPCDPPEEDAFATPETRPMIDLSTPKTATAPSDSSVGIARPPSHSSFKTPSVSNAGNSSANAAVKKPRVVDVAGGGTPNPRVRKSYRRPLTEEDADDAFARRSSRLSFSSVTSADDTPPETKFALMLSINLRTTVSADSLVTPHVATRLFHHEDTPEESNVSDRKRRLKLARGHAGDGSQQLLCLLSSFGSVYQKVCMYMCREALFLLQQLPPSQLASGWAQHQIGRSHFEMADYNSAHEVFKAMHRAEPHRMAGLDVYSTTLWHLKKEVELSYLAQEVTEFDKLSSEAWCVAGNCFSLQKEHDTALIFFQRAIQLDPSFTYAYTLSGHEYVANEDFEKAIHCYRHAIRTDPRHYNAWYGLGTIYYRQEKFEFAEYHFKRALEINPRSSLLHCFLGMVLHSTRKFDEALHVLAIAGELQPLNPQARFQRANVLITQHRFEEALTELKIVRNFAPRESSVHFMMGKVAKKLGHVDDAMKFFTTALYFHPKDNHLIKAAIDKINDPELDDDEQV